MDYSYGDVVERIFENFKEAQKRFIIVEGPNYIDKSFIKKCATLSVREKYDLIYFLGNSHEACEDVVNNFKTLHVKGLVWYQGIQRVCQNQKLLGVAVKLGLPPFMACNECVYNIFNKMSGRKISDLILKELSEGILIGKFSEREEICLYPLVRKLILSPFHFSRILEALRSKRRSPIIVATYYPFIHPLTIAYLLRKAEREKGTHNVLVVFDKGDRLFWDGIVFRMPKPKILDSDITILRRFSTKTVNLAKFLNIYLDLYTIFERLVVGKFTLYKARKLLKSMLDRGNERVVNATFRKGEEIPKALWNEKKKTKIFKYLSVLNPYTLFSYKVLPLDVASTIKSHKGSIIFNNYLLSDYILSNTKYPFKTSTKIVLTSVYPRNARKFFYKYREPYEIQIPEPNVYYFIFKIFDDPSLGRYKLIQAQPSLYKRRFCELLRRSVELYYNTFNRYPRGIIAFWGDSKQYKIVKNYTTLIPELQVKSSKVEEYEDYVKFTLPQTTISVIMSYFGSKFSKSFDLPHLDISIALAPPISTLKMQQMSIIRLYNQIGRAKAIAKSIQACLRIIRSTSAKVPKLIGLELSFASIEYMEPFPGWFLRHVIKNKSKYLGEVNLTKTHRS